MCVLVGVDAEVDGSEITTDVSAWGHDEGCKLVKFRDNSRSEGHRRGVSGPEGANRVKTVTKVKVTFGPDLTRFSVQHLIFHERREGSIVTVRRESSLLQIKNFQTLEFLF